MAQLGFFDVQRRYEGLDRKQDPLVLLAALIPWESFRADLHAALVSFGPRTGARKSAAGRKPWDEVLIFKALVLQTLYNLSDEQTEYQIRDRLSFVRFLGLGLEGGVPDATTLWLYREAWTKAGLMEKLFASFDRYLREQGYRAQGGQIVDASIVAAPRQRITAEEKAAVIAGETPSGWAAKPAKLRQKDRDARWTKKNGSSQFGYKNHISIDRKYKLIRLFTVSNAGLHDSQVFADLLDWNNSARDVWADAAYRSATSRAMLDEFELRSHIHRRNERGHPLTERQQAANTVRSRVRARVEHVFGHMTTSMGGKFLRTIGLARARTKIGAMNLVYNMSRFISLHRQQTRAA